MSKLIDKLRNFRTTVSEYKVYLNRSLTYLSVGNFLMILVVFFNQNAEYLPFAATKINLILSAIVLAVLAIFFGWVDIKLGLYNAEQNKASKHNPFFTETKANTDKILEELHSLKQEVAELKKEVKK